MVFSIAPVLTNDSTFLRCVPNLIAYRLVDCTFNLKNDILKKKRKECFNKEKNVLIKTYVIFQEMRDKTIHFIIFRVFFPRIFRIY